MHEHERLVLAGLVEDLLVAYLVHDLVPLDRLLLRDADKLLLERTWTVGRVEVEKALCRVDTEESRDVLVVREGCGETHQPHILARLLHAPDRARDHRLEHWTTFIMQQVNLVDDD